MSYILVKIKSLFSILISSIFIFLLFYYFFHDNEVKNIGMEIIKLWVFKVILSIVPMYFCSILIVSNPFIFKLLYKLNFFKKLFENEKALAIYLISFFTGNPTSSILLNKSIEKKEISLPQAQIIFDTCSYLSPLFIIIMLGNKLGFIILISMFISTFILYFIKVKNITFEKNLNNNILNVADNINNIINDLPTILLKILISMWIVALVKIPFSCNNIIIKFGLDLFEISTGLDNILKYEINYLIKLIFISVLTSLNGLAIMLQIFACIKKTRLSFKKFIKTRIIHVFLNIFCSLVIYYLFKFLA